MQDLATVPEFTAVLLARRLRDETVGVLGTRSEVAAAGCALAQLSTAPGLSFLSGPSGVVNPRPGRLLPIADEALIDGAEALTELTDNIDLIDWSRRAFDFAVLGGIQVDRFGNLNTVAVGDWAKPKVRGPGAIGASVLAGHAREFFIVLGEHSTRNFRPEVDFVSALGFGRTGREREALGLPGRGPSLLISPLGTFDFGGAGHTMRIRTVHPWSSVEEIRENTGFELAHHEDVRTTPVPRAQELELLRTAVDTTGVLRS
ncbi:CoA-transferase subunit beta [Amycolatopsis sp.]|uniref:CoA-transferase subunit beta n=1 Tax=Amycolatopsis sp. TaxID=37632 RepID=UPI002BAE0FF0|nr:CoA-transferase [Amycolatopsis sp.]HVV11242.1 CoA-transferase [Amycolatopsis sp.]